MALPPALIVDGLSDKAEVRVLDHPLKAGSLEDFGEAALKLPHIFPDFQFCSDVLQVEKTFTRRQLHHGLLMYQRSPHDYYDRGFRHCQHFTADLFYWLTGQFQDCYTSVFRPLHVVHLDWFTDGGDEEARRDSSGSEGGVSQPA